MRFLIEGLQSIWRNIGYGLVARRYEGLDLYAMMHMFWFSRAIHTMADLRLADHLKQPRTARELAELTGCQADPLERLLMFLKSSGVLTLDGQSRFQLHRRALTMASDAAISLRPWADVLGNEVWKAATQLTQTVRSGTGGFELATGQTYWEFLAGHADRRACFDEGMGIWTQVHSPEVVRKLRLKDRKVLVDVGGGGGRMMIAILKANPHLQGIVFDREETMSTARRNIAEAGLSDRLQARSGNFLEDVPEGDSYLIKHALHDWRDEFATQILQAVRRRTPENGRLFIVDAVLGQDRAGERFRRLLDIQQLLWTREGKERTQDDFTKLLSAARFRLDKVRRTAFHDVSVIEASPTR
ncbi:MAG: hypothetical protein IT428_30225 [Planctomycetaceae bacterium]|nr:hypothetical protein [Planctomycetaceae bacterium]